MENQMENQKKIDERLKNAKEEYEKYVKENYKEYWIVDLTTGEILEEISREKDIDAILEAEERYNEYGKKVAVLRKSCTEKIKRVGHVGYTQKRGGAGTSEDGVPEEYAKRRKKLHRLLNIPGQLSLQL